MQKSIDYSKLTLLVHTFISLILVSSLFLVKKDLAQALLYGSVLFNVYLRLLYANFDLLLNHKRLSVVVGILSALRAFLVAAVLAFFILKLKLNLIGLALSFIIYKLVLLGLGFYASHNRRDIR